MRFSAEQQTVFQKENVIRKSEIGGQLVDVWLCEDGQEVSRSTEGIFSIVEAREGMSGTASVPLPGRDGPALAAATARVYLEMFRLLDAKPDLRLLRVWHYIPFINEPVAGRGGLTDMYRYFNKGRFDAYLQHFGDDARSWMLAAASAVGTQDKMLSVEFFAAPSVPAFLENEAQVPPRGYSAKFGPVPPLFVRGAVFESGGRRILLSSGTAAIRGEDSLYEGDAGAQFAGAMNNLALLAGEKNLRRHGAGPGFEIGDLQILRVYYRREEDRAALEGLAAGVVPPGCGVSMVHADICRPELLTEVEGVFAVP